mgnify:CR=1 FL=1
MNQTNPASAEHFFTSDFLTLKKEGRNLLMQGSYEDALHVLNKALALENDAADILFLLGRCMHGMDRLQEALDFYNRSLALAAAVETYNAICDIFLARKQPLDTITVCELAEKRNIANYDTMIRKAMAHTIKNDIGAGLKLMIEAIEKQPQNPDARAFISATVQGSVPKYNEAFKMALLQCLQSEDMEHQYLAGAWMQQLMEDPNGQSMRDLMQCTDYGSFSILYSDPAKRHYVLSSYVRVGIEKQVLADIGFERFLTHLRRFYLETVMASDELGTEEKALVCSLATHCFLTEFCLEETPEETAMVTTLLQQIETATTYIHPDDLAVFACYRLLSDLKNADFIARPGELRRRETGTLIRYHLDEPAREREIKKTIKRISPIQDSVSLAVQEQYEENPYPRWLHCNRLAPLVDRPKQNQNIKVLIAGCGTGKQVVQLASVLPRADITAVDLSSSSLAYAIRKTEEYNIDNITFLHGDILNLRDALEPGSFDRIDSTGVLHHMQDPMAGWKVLTDLLKTGGMMNIALYSEASRRGVVEAREMIRDKGFTPDPQGIRACRAYMKTLPHNTPLGKVARWRDFYIMSDCRDLIFHVQEHRFTLPQIQECLKELGLTFRGFVNVMAPQLEAYKKKYPGEIPSADLEKWHILEQENPEVFHSMYRFHCSKPLN